MLCKNNAFDSRIFRKNAEMNSNSLLQVRKLTLRITHLDGEITPVNNVSFSVNTGETLAIVGESGSGKTMSALALLDLLPPGGRISSGEILWQGEKWADPEINRLAKLRGRHIAIIFQDALSALNPVFRIGTQMVDILRRHFPHLRKTARDQALSLLAQVGLAEPARVFRAYPHQLSGGMAQRVMIALALSCRPRLIIADEPTTALDISTQCHILNLLRKMQNQHQFALILISHDISVVAAMADRVAVMRHGKIVEQGGVQDILTNPAHFYTRELLGAQIVPGALDVARPVY